MYYLMETDYFEKPNVYRTDSLITEFKFKPSRWVTGQLIGEPKQPLRVEFWQNGGDGLAEIYLDSVPLFSSEFIAALREVGVRNLQCFPVEITEREGGTIHKSYEAVNILGCVQCADMTKSEFTDFIGQGITAVSFRHLLLDGKKCSNFLIFRLAESVTSIIVHEVVKQEIERKGFRYFSLRPLQS